MGRAYATPRYLSTVAAVSPAQLKLEFAGELEERRAASMLGGGEDRIVKQVREHYGCIPIAAVRRRFPNGTLDTQDVGLLGGLSLYLYLRGCVGVDAIVVVVGCGMDRPCGGLSSVAFSLTHQTPPFTRTIHTSP